MKDDIEELHEIGRQEKELENNRRVLFKDTTGFMDAVLPEKELTKGKLSKIEIRMINCLQSVSAFCYFWAFCSSADIKTEYEFTQGMIQGLQKHSNNCGLETFSFNLKELSALYK